MNSVWLRLTDRERILVSSGAVLIVFFIVYMLLISPVLNAKESAASALDGQKKMYSRVVTLAKQAGRSASQHKMNMSERLPIREAATEASRVVGIPISRIQPGSNDKVTFWIDRANTSEIAMWLLLLEDEYRWQATKLSLNKNADSDTLRGQFEFSGT